MKTKIIYLRNLKKISTFRAHFFKFFRITKFKSIYVSVFSQMMFENDDKKYSLGKTFILNVKNQDEKLSYLELVCTSYLTLISNKKSIKPKKIEIQFIEINKEAYDNFVKRLNNFENVNNPQNFSKLINLNNLGKRYYSTTNKKSKTNSMITRVINLKTDLNPRYLRDYLFKFFRTEHFNSNFIYVLTKSTVDDGIITLGYKELIDITNKNDIKNYIDHVSTYFQKHKDKYYPKVDDSLLINYFESDQKSYKKHIRNLKLNKTFDSVISEGIISENNIPFNTMYNSWGDLKIISNTKSIITNVMFDNSIKLIEITKLNYNQTFCCVLFKNSYKTISFVDTDTKKDLDKIKRVYSDTDLIVYFDQNKPFFSFDSSSYASQFELDKNGNKTNRRVDVIQPIKPAESLKYNYGTLDIETYIENGIFKILCMCFCYLDSNDKLQSYSFYSSDYESTTSLLKSAFDELFTEKFNKKYIYIHNGANFDLVFLVPYLLSRSDIKLDPIYKDGKFISIIFSYGKTINKQGRAQYKYVLAIRDSYMLLSASLNKLGAAFNVDVQKDIYPYDFPNKDNLNYIGEVPDYLYFDPHKVSVDDYNKYVERFKDTKWNLKTETLKYCSIDCESLHQILRNFSDLIFNRFNVDIFECPTLPSLAFKIFRTNFLAENTLPIINKKIYDELINAYYGGHVDLYIPKGPVDTNLTVNKLKLLDIPKLVAQKGVDYIKSIFKTVKHYDVNALFPSAMLKYEFPTDIIGRFIGDIRLVSSYSHYYNENLGIYKVNVVAPNIKHPLLPAKIGNQMLYPSGNWTGWYFSEEIKNAEKYGYKFDILGGYIFESKNIFAEYITRLNSIKENSDKNSSMYLIAKLFLNSLYGKMAISPHLNDYSFWTKDEFNEKIKDIKIKEGIQDWVDFDTHYLVGFKNQCDYMPANIAVGLSITAYSRIIMSRFKNRDDITLYYSDTDSAFVDVYLPDEFVDSKQIGLYKLEAEYLLFIGIAPKVYGAMDVNGNCYTKVKGFKDNVPLETLESLLYKNKSETLIQSKWFKSMKDSNISISVSPYDLKPNNNKRLNVYEKNQFVSTQNVIVENGKRVSPK